MTVIIDNSLCCMNLTMPQPGRELAKYAEALFQAGVRYLMLDSNMVKYFKNSVHNGKFIFYLRSEEDMKYIEDMDFAYVFVPVRLTYLIPGIKCPVMLDIDCGETPFDRISKPELREYIESGKITCLSVSGNFSADDLELETFVYWYTKSFALPLNICPLNFFLQGTEKTLGVFMAGANSVMLSFGSKCSYTSLEEVMFALERYFRISITPDFKYDLATAALSFTKLTGTLSSGIQLQIEQNMHIPVNSEGATDRSLVRYMLKSGLAVEKNRIKINKGCSGLDEKALKEMGVMPELVDELLSALKECEMPISSDNLAGDSEETAINNNYIKDGYYLM